MGSLRGGVLEEKGTQGGRSSISKRGREGEIIKGVEKKWPVR